MDNNTPAADDEEPNPAYTIIKGFVVFLLLVMFIFSGLFIIAIPAAIGWLALREAVNEAE